MKLIEPFAGSLALSAWAAGASSLIGYMGGKRALAPAIAAAAGLERGQIEHFYCADAGPWGDFWRHFPGYGPILAARFEAWASEGRELPALWRELVQHPPAADPMVRLSQFLVLQSRTASASPIWWDGVRWVMPSGSTKKPWNAQQAHASHLSAATSRGRHHIDTDPGRVADERRTGIIDPRTIATRIRSLHGAIGHRLTAHHGDTFELLDKLPADLSKYVAYLDPPYVGCTPYAAACSRERVLELARAYDARGAIVLVSEGAPMPLKGWHTVDLAPARAVKRWTAAQRGEWLTMNRPPAKRPAAQLTLWAGAAA